jgi:PST family polysaccharide transporter/lipopolysaccharide exporter
MTIKSRASAGIVYFLVQTIATKFFALLAQVFLATLLPVRDFGLIALARTVIDVANQLANPGLASVLLQKSSLLSTLINSATWLGLIWSSVIATIVIMLAPSFGRIFDSPEIVPLIWILAFAIPFTVCGSIFQTVLKVQLLFGKLAIVAFISVSLTLCMQVGLANSGFGALSFAIPTAVIATFVCLLIYCMAKPRLYPTPQIGNWHALVNDSRWVYIGNVAMSVVAVADYAILGLVSTDYQVGIYMFAFSLSMQSITLVTVSLASVLQPALVNIKGEGGEQIEAFYSASKLLAFVGIPICLLQVVLAKPLIELFFPERWGPSVLLIELLSVAMSVRIVSANCGSLLLAQQRYKTFAWVTLLYMCMFVTICYFGAVLRGASGVAIGTIVVSFIMGGISIYVAIISHPKALQRTANIFFGPYCLAVPVMFISFYVRESISQNALVEFFSTFATFVLMYVIAARVFLPKRALQVKTELNMLVVSFMSRRKIGS